jgi:hypothetical protein
MKRKWGQADGEDGNRHRHSSKNNRDPNGQSNRKIRSICQKAQSNNDTTSNEWTVLLRLIIYTVAVTLHALIRNWAMNTHAQIIHVFFQFSSVSDEGCYSIGNHCLFTPFPHVFIYSISPIVVFALCLTCWLGFDGYMLIIDIYIYVYTHIYRQQVCFFNHGVSWNTIRSHHTYTYKHSHKHHLSCIRITEKKKIQIFSN